MAIDPLLPRYEQALLLSNWPSDLPRNDLLYSLIIPSDYAGILRKYSNNFKYDAAQAPHLRISFEDHVSDIEKLVCGIAALQAFVQTNWTGPEVELEPSDLLGESLDKDLVNSHAVEGLTMSGEPAYHLTKKATFLWLARSIFALDCWRNSPLGSISAWQLRQGLVNLRLLDTPVALPGELLERVEAYIATLPATSEGTDVKTSLTLLLGMFHAQFIHLSSAATKVSSETFYSAAKDAGLQYELTGRLGKRTKWQVDEKSQLVVLAKSRERTDGWQPREVMSLRPEADTQLPERASDQPKDLLLNDDTLLERTQFTSTVSSNPGEESSFASIDPNHQPVLHPLDECVLLAMSLSITNTSPSHGLTTNQIQAFVSRILEDGSQNWSVHSMGLLLRSRLEANRSRTVERGLLQMQSLVDQLKLESISKPKTEKDLDLEKGATPRERLQYFYCLNLPSTWELERELASRYLGLGVVRSAMEIFTRLEMWEDVAKCYSSLGEPEKAIRVVKDLLDGKILESETNMAVRRGQALSNAQKAKLWCLLGDLEHNPQLYAKAWEVSGQTSSRAVRSLGQYYFQKQEYTKAQTYLEKALAINPLFVKVWFILGAAAMRNEDWAVAERAFRRCTSLEEDDGESWNNLATVILKQTTSNSAPSDDEARDANFSKKRIAFTCLAQAIKHSYDSWRIWTNYLLVAVDIGDLMEACRALARLVELRGEKDGENAVDLEILDRLVDVVGREVATANEISEGPADTQRGLPGRVRALFEGTILPRIAGSSHIYSSYAKLLYAVGDLSGSLQARMKAYRVDIVMNDKVASDKAVFEKAAERVLETVDFLRNLGPKEVQGQMAMPDWKSQARSVLRTFLGRTKETFGEEPAWETVQAELEDLKNA